MNKKIALIDLDHTVVDWDAGMIPLLKELESPEEKGLYDYSDMWALEKKHPHIANRFHSIHSKQGFWLNLKPIQAGLDLYHEASKNFKVYILTKALKWCSLAWKEKVDWIHKWIGKDVEIMVVTDKQLVRGDFLYDDLPKNAIDWLNNNPDGRVLMPTRAHNKQFQATTNDNRVTFWDDTKTVSKMDAFGDNEIVTDFHIPHQFLKSILNAPNKYEG